MNDAHRLRLATPADASAIRDLTRAAYAKWIPVIGREPLPMTVAYENAVLLHRFDLLYVGEKLAGLIETVPETDELLIVNVAVSPAYQGHGFGRKLLAHAETLAVSHGFGKTRLYTNKAFAANGALYDKLGYRVDREEAFMGGIAVYMSKLLKS
jgi:ribosomal protein S18 acetylase RimI-like enzyme